MDATTLVRMDASTVRETCRFGEESSACQAARKAEREWNAQLARNRAEGDRLRGKREQKAAAEAQARADARDAERQAAADALKAWLRTQFFAANPAASEADYARVAEQLWDAELVRRATEGRNADVAALRRSGDYAPM